MVTCAIITYKKIMYNNVLHFINECHMECTNFYLEGCLLREWL